MTSTKLPGTFLLLRPGVLGGSLPSLSPRSLGVLPPFPGGSPPPGSPGGAAPASAISQVDSVWEWEAKQMLCGQYANRMLGCQLLIPCKRLAPD